MLRISLVLLLVTGYFSVARELRAHQRAPEYVAQQGRPPGGGQGGGMGHGGMGSGGQVNSGARWNRGHGGNRNFNSYWYNPYFYGFPVYPQNFAYSWYQRPYPYHLDYYRARPSIPYATDQNGLYGSPAENPNGTGYAAPPVTNFGAPTYETRNYAPQLAPQSGSLPLFRPAPTRNYTGAYYW